MKIDAEISRAMNYPSLETSIYAQNLLDDTLKNGLGNSIWDEPSNLNIWMN